MKDIYSRSEDCSVLAIQIKKNLGDKARLTGDIHNELGEGRYFSSYRINSENTLVSNNFVNL